MARSVKARPAAGRMTLDRAIELILEDFRKDGCARETIVQVIQAFNLIKMRLGITKVSELRNALSRLATLDGISESYRRAKLKLLHAALGRAVGMGLLRSIPKPQAVDVGAHAPPRAIVPVAFSEFRKVILDLYRRMKGRPSTIRNMDIALRFMDKKLRVQTTADLGDIPRRLAAFEGISDIYRIAMAQRIRAICKHAVRMDILASVPEFPGIPRIPCLPRVASGPRAAPSRGDVRKLFIRLSADAASWDGRRLYTLASVVHYTGIPLADALGLRVREIDPSEATIWLRRRRGIRSSSPPSPVSIPDKLRPILAKWKGMTGSRFLFPNKGRTSALRKHVANKQLQEAASAEGIAMPFTFELLRRSYSGRRAPTGDLKSRQLISRPESATSRRTLSSTIWLGRPGEPVYIDGQRKPALREGPHSVVTALLDAGSNGLDEYELKDKSGRGGWWRMLKSLKQSDADWDRILVFPGGPWGRYRINATRDPDC